MTRPTRDDSLRLMRIRTLPACLILQQPSLVRALGSYECRALECNVSPAFEAKRHWFGVRAGRQCFAIKVV
jgi:hypothetical protein